MTNYNKYEIYVDKIELATYIEENNIKDKRIFEVDEKDFIYVAKNEGMVNFFSQFFDTIDGTFCESIHDQISSPTKVTAEEFLIAIGYLEGTEQSELEEKLKVEDVYYIDSEYPSDTDYLWMSQHSDGEIFINIREGCYTTSITLSPESLISLGKDLIQIGIQKQIEEEDNED